jgi:hypothetical protein
MALSHRQQGPSLLDLPPDVTRAILHRAGPRSRLLCMATADLYGPLPSLTPRGMRTIQRLESTLKRLCRRKELRSLDLTQAPDLVSDNNLQLIFSALPHLQQLHLPLTSQVSAAGLAALQPLLSSLTALHIHPTWQFDWTRTDQSLRVAHQLTHLMSLAQLRELTLPASTASIVRSRCRLPAPGRGSWSANCAPC